MRVVIIGPGIMPIPPKGWGAVESLIWDISETLKTMGVDVHIVNTPNPDDIVKQVNALTPDVVHLQYDDFYYIMDHIRCPKKFATSHYGYLEHPTFKDYQHYQHNIFKGFVNGRFTICALSEGIRQRYITAGCNPSRVLLTPNGASDAVFRYSETCKYPDTTLYLGKIEERKKQYKYQYIPSIHFAGNVICPKFSTSSPRYLGEWTKPKLYDTMTDYANLALLSDGEAHPLVVCEALICGLGVVVSNVAAANLDRSKPWVTVIPDDKLDDLDYVAQKLKENRGASVASRADIREYALANFSWNVCVRHLLDIYCSG
uniref:Glycosyltransferase n=1 Tax=viral metagenome TaxID=1070528 RepID=A0A6C0HJR9_9ZZZZ